MELGLTERDAAGDGSEVAGERAPAPDLTVAR